MRIKPAFSYSVIFGLLGFLLGASISFLFFVYSVKLIDATIFKNQSWSLLMTWVWIILAIGILIFIVLWFIKLGWRLGKKQGVSKLPWFFEILLMLVLILFVSNIIFVVYKVILGNKNQGEVESTKIKSGEIQYIHPEFKDEGLEINVGIDALDQPKFQINIKLIATSDVNKENIVQVTEDISLAAVDKEFHGFIRWEELTKAYYEIFKRKSGQVILDKDVDEDFSVKVETRVLPENGFGGDKNLSKLISAQSTIVRLAIHCSEAQCQVIKKLKPVQETSESSQ